jgi:hypothetical protein
MKTTDRKPTNEAPASFRTDTGSPTPITQLRTLIDLHKAALVTLKAVKS